MSRCSVECGGSCGESKYERSMRTAQELNGPRGNAISGCCAQFLRAAYIAPIPDWCAIYIYIYRFLLTTTLWTIDHNFMDIFIHNTRCPGSAGQYSEYFSNLTSLPAVYRTTTTVSKIASQPATPPTA